MSSVHEFSTHLLLIEFALMSCSAAEMIIILSKMLQAIAAESSSFLLKHSMMQHTQDVFDVASSLHTRPLHCTDINSRRVITLVL
jgi:hypothetical protein